jgi:hypothetical protein
MRRTRCWLERGLFALAAAFSVLASTPLFAQQAPAPAQPRLQPLPADQVLSWVAAAVQEEADLGRLAQSHGATPEVRRFGQLLVGDARVEMGHLDYVAEGHGIPLRTPASIPLALRSHLATLQGAEFDGEFLRLERAIDGRAVSVIAQAAPAITNGAARGAMRSVQPLFDQHLRLAVALAQKGK